MVKINQLLATGLLAMTFSNASAAYAKGIDSFTGDKSKAYPHLKELCTAYDHWSVGQELIKANLENQCLNESIVEKFRFNEKQKKEYCYVTAEKNMNQHIHAGFLSDYIKQEIPNLMLEEQDIDMMKTKLDKLCK